MINCDASDLLPSLEEPIFACFQNKGICKACLAGIIEGRNALFTKRQLHRIHFAGTQQLCLSKSNQYLFCLAQLSLGCAAPEHHHFTTRAASGIGHTGSYGVYILCLLKTHSLAFEAGIGKAKTKGIQDLIFGEGFKIAVTYKDIFCVAVELLTAEIGAAGVILVALCNGVRQLAAGIYFTRQHICHRIAAFHTALPGDQNRG